MVTRPGVVERFGGFDPALGAGTPARSGEDTLLFMRLLRAGGTIAYRPSVLVRHFHRREPAGLRDQLAGYGIGLTAAYTALLRCDPRALGTLLTLAPRALRYPAASRRRSERSCRRVGAMARARAHGPGPGRPAGHAPWARRLSARRTPSTTDWPGKQCDAASPGTGDADRPGRCHPPAHARRQRWATGGLSRRPYLRASPGPAGGCGHDRVRCRRPRPRGTPAGAALGRG